MSGDLCYKWRLDSGQGCESVLSKAARLAVELRRHSLTDCFLSCLQLPEPNWQMRGSRSSGVGAMSGGAAGGQGSAFSLHTETLAWTFSDAPLSPVFLRVVYLNARRLTPVVNGPF